MKRMRSVALEDIRCYAYHGFHEIEQSIGTEFSVDVFTSWATDTPVEDEIVRTVNYEMIFRIVEQEMMVSSKLLETVAERIADHIHLSFPFVAHVKVTIHKQVQLGGSVRRASVTESRDF